MSSATVNTCAACGKEGGDGLKSCGACKLVKYCSKECQISHRPMHKKECKKRAAELYDEKLFKDHPPQEECPICLVPLINGNKTESFQSCCGKVICNGCVYAMMLSEGKDLCAFCRTPPACSNEKDIKRLNKLMDNENDLAFYQLGGCYAQGIIGLPQDDQKANELYLKAGELGCIEAYYSLGHSYDQGRGVEVDKRKAKHYYELAAIGGDNQARHDLGCLEGQAGIHHRAMKHMIIAARAGHEKALEGVKLGFKSGLIKKDEYANTLRAYQKIQDETKSDDREKALASDMFQEMFR